MKMWNRISGIGSCNIIYNLIEKDQDVCSTAQDLSSLNQALQVVSFEKYLTVHLLLLELHSILTGGGEWFSSACTIQ